MGKDFVFRKDRNFSKADRGKKIGAPAHSLSLPRSKAALSDSVAAGNDRDRNPVQP